MPINSFAYECTALADTRLKDIKDKLAQNMIAEGFSPIQVEPASGEDAFSIHLLLGGSTTADVIPLFNHPIPVMGRRRGGGQVQELAVDMRGWGKWHPPSQQFQVRNQSEYDWQLRRAAMNQLWISESPNRLRDLSRLPIAVYAALMGEAISRRFMLDPSQKILISILSAFFYLGLFTDESQYEEERLRKIADVISETTRAPAERVFDVIESLPVIETLADLCNVIREKANTPALNNLNVGVLFTILANNWTFTGREALLVGLEHPPTWMTVIYACLAEAISKRTALAKLVQTHDRAQAGDRFVKAMQAQLKFVDLQVI